MRTLCLLLILANALFFVWAQLIDVDVANLDRAPVASATSAPPIVLAREVQKESERAAEPAAEEIEADEIRDVQPPSVEPLAPSTSGSGELARADGTACTTIGPFADLPQAAQAQAALRGAGFEPRQRLVQGELWVGYWVSVQGLATRESAEDALKTLTANDITDVYLMPGADPANVLSLGVFSDYQRAQRRAAEVRGLGLEPSIEDRKRAGSVYWIDVELKQPGQVIDSTLLQTDPGKIMRLEMRACPASAAG